MAPKGGGKGGGGSSGGSGRKSSASCPECVAPLELQGSDWKNKILIGAFVVDIIVAIVLIGCMILQTRFKWVRESLALDKLRNKGFYYAAGSLFIMYILYIVDIVLNEEEHVTTRLYYLMYIFGDLFWRIADILILAIIFRCIAESSLANLARKLAKFHKLIIYVLTFLSVAAFAIYVTRIVHQIMTRYMDQNVYKTYEYITVVYHALYLVAALLAGWESVTLFLRSRSKQSTLLVALVAPSFVLHALFALIVAAITMYYTNWDLRYENFDLRMACTFIVDITNIGIYAGVILVGWTEFKPGGGNRGKYAYAGNVNNGVHGI